MVEEAAAQRLHSERSARRRWGPLGHRVVELNIVDLRTGVENRAGGQAVSQSVIVEQWTASQSASSARSGSRRGVRAEEQSRSRCEPQPRYRETRVCRLRRRYRCAHAGLVGTLTPQPTRWEGVPLLASAVGVHDSQRPLRRRARSRLREPASRRHSREAVRVPAAPTRVPSR
jgi:hypothetical protein